MPTKVVTSDSFSEVLEGGVFELQIFTPTELPGLRWASLMGSDLAQSWVDRIFDMVQELENPTMVRRTCVCCDRPQFYNSPLSFVFATSTSPNATSSLAGVMCSDCADTSQEVLAKWNAVIHKLLPGTRNVTHPEGGRA